MKKQDGKKLPKILVIVGPTATGKSSLAVGLARKFKGEVVSADSRQVYKGLDIGSGKITKAEMKGVPHHLLDVVSPKDRQSERYTVDDYKKDGKAAIDRILASGKLPIVCGGTGFYIDALVFDETFPDVAPNQPLRARLAKHSTERLMKEIERLDPRRARELDPHNKVRIIRAIEIARVLGTVPKVTRKKQYDALFIGLNPDPLELRKKIHKRLIARIDAGMIREVSDLHKKGVSWRRMYAFGLEYRFVSLHLQKKLSKEEMLAALELEIARYAKRQMTWFKMNPAIKWFQPSQKSQIEREAADFLKYRISRT